MNKSIKKERLLDNANMNTKILQKASNKTTTINSSKLS